ncbi:TPA: lysozyme inhibitor LprI family protein [Pseudomonas aeruginosa]
MRRMMKGIAVLSAWLATSLSTAQATSFDCAKAQNFAETTICSLAPLQSLDEDLNSQYVRAIDRVPEKVKAEVRQSQRAWLKRRNACTTASCISAAMTDQIRTLAQWGTEAPAAPKVEVISTLAPSPSVTSDLPPQNGEFDVNRGAPVPAVQTDSTAAAPGSTHADRSLSMPTQDMRPFKIALVAMFALLLVCIWLHTRGSMCIYADFTDALWTTLTPLLAIGTYFLAEWLEFSKTAAGWSALAVLSLMSLQILIQTYRSNGFSPYFILALYAKVVLFTLFIFLMALLLLGGGTKSDRRRRRGWAVAAGALFAFFTAWMCRNRHFSHIDDYLAGRA